MARNCSCFAASALPLISPELPSSVKMESNAASIESFNADMSIVSGSKADPEAALCNETLDAEGIKKEAGCVVCGAAGAVGVGAMATGAAAATVVCSVLSCLTPPFGLDVILNVNKN
jgi:hypothetical protein